LKNAFCFPSILNRRHGFRQLFVCEFRQRA
jgi:hypothetical protein